MIYLFYVIVFGGLALGVLLLMSASLYDLKEAKKSQQYRLHPFSRTLRKRPMISVIVMAHNNEATIESCLSSISHSSYRNYEILVIDNTSKDNTDKFVRQFMANHDKQSIKLHTKRVYVANEGALLLSTKKLVHGEVVMVIQADSILDKNALRNSARWFSLEDSLGILSTNVKIITTPTILGLTQEFAYLSRSLLQKNNSLKNYYSDGYKSACAVYSYSTLFSKSITSKKKANSCYANDVVIYMSPAASYKQVTSQQLKRQIYNLKRLAGMRGTNSTAKNQLIARFVHWMKGLLLLLLPLVGAITIGFIIYLSVNLHTSLFLAISWLALFGFLFLTITSDVYLKFRQKLRLSLLAPIMYGLFYLMTIFQTIMLTVSLLYLEFIFCKNLVLGTLRFSKRLIS